MKLNKEIIERLISDLKEMLEGKLSPTWRKKYQTRIEKLQHKLDAKEGFVCRLK